MPHENPPHARSSTDQRPADGLPLPVEILRFIASIYLHVFKRFRVVNGGRTPSSGPVILVANHATAYDPVCLQVACGHRLIRFMQAREYYEKPLIHRLYQLLRVIPVNRTGNDTAGIRTALRALSNGGCLGIYPEGRISEDGEMHDARRGVALFALMTDATVIPAYLHSTIPYRGMILDFFLLNRVTLYFGDPIHLHDLAGRHRDPEALDLALKRIMDGIHYLRNQYATPLPASTADPSLDPVPVPIPVSSSDPSSPSAEK